MLNIVLGYIWRYVQTVWPYFVVIGFFSLVNISIFYLGRWVEHRKWRREIKNGNRLGELAQEQLKKRDERIRRLTKEIAQLEGRIEQVGAKHRRLLGLAQEMINVAVSENPELLQKRKRID